MDRELIIRAVPILRAALVFPFRPWAAVPVLAAHPRSAVAVAAPATFLFAYLLARGCAAGDAAVAAAGMLALTVPTAAAGVLGCDPARMLLGRPFSARALAGPCAVFTAWTPVLFVALLAALKALGSGAGAALFTGLILLVWALATGIAVVARDAGDDDDRGRLLVASCTGVAVCLLGLWLGLLAASAMVLALPAPATIEYAPAGSTLLVRPGDAGAPGDVVFVAGPGAERAVARVEPSGARVPIGVLAQKAENITDWPPVGRVFFRFGGSWGGAPVPCRGTD
jgi:hypothetical protein